MRLSTYICAAIAPFTVFVIVHSGCSYAKDTLEVSVTSRLNEETASEVSPNAWQTFKNTTSQTESQYETNCTGCDLMSPGVLQMSKIADPRITGGRLVEIVEFPFMGSLQKNRKHFCSLFIISKMWLLTAGQCTIEFDEEDGEPVFTKPRDYSVIVGSPIVTIKIRKACVRDEVRRRVDRMVWHPKFKAPFLVKDLVVVRVSRGLPFSDRVQPAKLPTAAVDPQRQFGRRCKVIGWGSPPLEMFRPQSAAMSLIKDECKKEINTKLVLVLQEVSLVVLSHSDCVSRYPWMESTLSKKDHICTNPDEHQDACNGDSGAPLFCDGTVVAFASWGAICRSATNTTTVFTRIDTNLDWIRTAMQWSKANLTSPPPNVVVLVTIGQLAMAVASICHV